MDPPVPPDGSCAREGCERERPEVAIRELDPFCSTPCCREWYELHEQPVWTPKAAPSKTTPTELQRLRRHVAVALARAARNG